MAGYFSGPRSHHGGNRARRHALRREIMGSRKAVRALRIKLEAPAEVLTCPLCGCYSHELVIKGRLVQQCNSNALHRLSQVLPITSTPSGTLEAA